ncbi:MAG: hypothetical protein AAF699_13760 [Pseudomonadota bacterium]
MVLASIIVGLLVLVAVFFFSRKSATNPGVQDANTGRAASVGRKAHNKSPRKASPPPASPFRSTSIVPGANACSAVTAIAEQRYLDSEQSVPKVPLPECDAARCDCRYARHEDRRDTDGDRRHPSGLQSELYETAGNANRRNQKSGRRNTDLS